MSILSDRSKTIAETSIDGVFVIYGGPGTGKTVLASTFPKSKEKPLLVLDI
jgi:ATP-dependent 26S proteasome regulatory subunit